MSPAHAFERLATHSVEDFAGRVGEVFRVAEPPLELHLEQVDELGAAPGPGRPQPFSLLFRGPAAHLLAQGIHSLENPGLGPLAIFLVPVSSDGQIAHYEAVFN